MTKDAIPEKLIIYDDHCLICNASVHTIEKKDKTNSIHFTHAQSEVVKMLQQRVTEKMNPDASVIFYNHGKLHFYSDAVIEVAKDLRFPYSLLKALIIFPKPWRDGMYRLIANNRYRLFKRRDNCLIPDENLRKKIV